MAETSREIDSRLEFPILLNWRHLYGHAVEVGVDRGTFSHHLLSCWHGSSFFGVDSYQPYEGLPGDREADYLMAVARYEQFGDRARLLRCSSTEGAKFLSELSYVKSFDFVYIDASHERGDVMVDLEAWWPLITPQGILAGHDFDNTHPGVMAAVNEFFMDKSTVVYLTHEKSCASWYAYKSGMPNTGWRRLP